MNKNHCMSQGMTHAEREELKDFACQCDVTGDTQSLSRTLVMVAHWMRQGQRIAFTEYASQWTEAQKDRKDGNHSTPKMAAQWSFSGKRCIKAGGSDYFPNGCDRELVDDETEIRHAVTVITAEYPQFNRDGLVLYSQDTGWENPLDLPSFMTAAISCLQWLRMNNLANNPIKSFPKDNPTSYGLKHNVERYNSRHHQHNDQPHYIPNGAMIAAMVASGYQFRQVSRMNALFNISKKNLEDISYGEEQ